MKKSQIIKIKNNAMFRHSILFLLILLFAFLWLFFLDWIGYVCPFRYIDLYCPGCGGTRMILSILQLDFYQAFRFNPLLFIYLVGFIIYFIVTVIVYFIKGTIIKLPIWVYGVLIGLLLVYMVLRNIPMFSYLAPTYV